MRIPAAGSTRYLSDAPGSVEMSCAQAFCTTRMPPKTKTYTAKNATSSSTTTATIRCARRGQAGDDDLDGDVAALGEDQRRAEQGEDLAASQLGPRHAEFWSTCRRGLPHDDRHECDERDDADRRGGRDQARPRRTTSSGPGRGAPSGGARRRRRPTARGVQVFTFTSVCSAGLTRGGAAYSPRPPGSRPRPGHVRPRRSRPGCPR